jgi:DNA-binding LacI/PurR family transcriptional regulator
MNRTISTCGRDKHQKISEEIRQQIESGEYQPGDRLPSYAELSKTFGVAANTVSLALRVLEQSGSVVRQQGRGVFVNDREDQGSSASSRSVNSGLVGFVLDNAESFYWAGLIRGAREGAEYYRRQLLLLGTDSCINWETLGGVILSGSGCEVVLSQMPPHLPCVSLFDPFEGTVGVVANYRDGVRQVIHHLVDLGHRRIACMVQPHPLFQLESYIDGYRSALRDAGIKPKRDWLRYFATAKNATGDSVDDYYRTRGYESMAAWLRDGWREVSCTALFVQNDCAAIGVIDALQQAGLRVPADVSVVSFDGSILCEHTTPRLTAVQMPLYDMGRRGVEALLQTMEDPRRSAETIVLPVELMERASTAPPGVL